MTDFDEIPVIHGDIANPTDNHNLGNNVHYNAPERAPRHYDKGKWAKKAGGQNHNQQPNKKISLANIVDDIKDDGKLDEYTHNKKTEMKRWNVFEETGANDKSVSERKYDKHLLKKYKILKVNTRLRVSAEKCFFPQC